MPNPYNNFDFNNQFPNPQFQQYRNSNFNFPQQYGNSNFNFPQQYGNSTNIPNIGNNNTQFYQGGGLGNQFQLNENPNPNPNFNFNQGGNVQPNGSFLGIGNNTWQGIGAGVTAAGNLAQSWLGFQKLNLGKESLKFEKDSFERNFAEQKKLTDKEIADRDRARKSAYK